MNAKTPIDPNQPKIQRVEVYWHTVTYKTVAIYATLIAIIIFAVIFLLEPGLYTWTIDHLNRTIGNGGAEVLPVSQTQAKFVNLDGKVQVKKVN